MRRLLLAAFIFALAGCYGPLDTESSEKVMNEVFALRKAGDVAKQLDYFMFSNEQDRSGYEKHLRERNEMTGEFLTSKLTKSGVKQIASDGLSGEFVFLVYRNVYKNGPAQERFLLKTNDSGETKIYSADFLGL